MFFHIALHIRLCPVQQWVDLQQSIFLQFQNFGVSARGSLIAANPADPCQHIFQGCLHRLDLVNVTTQVGVLQGQAASTLAGKNIPACIAVQVKYIQMPVGGKLLTKDGCFPKMITSIDEEDQQVPVDLTHHVQKRHTLCLKRRTHRDLGPERMDRPFDDLLGCFRLEFFREFFDFCGLKHGGIIPVIEYPRSQIALSHYKKAQFVTALGIISCMDSSTVARLIELNREFYTRFGESFSATRHRIQPGVRRVLETLRGDESILDLGCGNGEFARELAKWRHHGPYLGVDFSLSLLRDAESYSGAFSATFKQVDLTKFSEFDDQLSVDSHQSVTDRWSLITAFAVLHHIPSHDLRIDILKTVHKLLKPDGKFIHSNWQFLNSEKLKARIQPWEAAAISSLDVEPGDYLLDWRSGGEGLRYVHHFSESELGGLAQESGFQVVDTFYSDGEKGNLGLYQIWEPSL